MKDYLFWYPVFSIIPWSINYILARFDIVKTYIPLKFWIAGSFSIAWIQYVASKPSGQYWPVYLLFMFGVPYGIFWFFSSFPGSEYDEYTDKPDTEIQTNNPLNMGESNKSVEINENNLSLKDYVFGIGFLLILIAGFGTWLLKQFS